jgi:hypothetical protein
LSLNFSFLYFSILITFYRTDFLFKYFSTLKWFLLLYLLFYKQYII